MIMNFKKYPKIRRIGHEDNSGILESYLERPQGSVLNEIEG